MRPAFSDLPAVDDEDLVRWPDRGQPVCDRRARLVQPVDEDLTVPSRVCPAWPRVLAAARSRRSPRHHRCRGETCSPARCLPPILPITRRSGAFTPGETMDDLLLSVPEVTEGLGQDRTSERTAAASGVDACGQCILDIIYRLS
jgi:hypothetical protein